MPSSYCPKCGKETHWRNQRGSSVPKTCSNCGFSPLQRFKCKVCRDRNYVYPDGIGKCEPVKCEHPLMPDIFREK